MIASLTAACLLFVVSAKEYVRDLVRGLDWTVGREMVSFGWPTIVSAFAFYALNLLDRFSSSTTGAPRRALRRRLSLHPIVLVGVFAFRLAGRMPTPGSKDRHPQMVARGARWFFARSGFLAGPSRRGSCRLPCSA